MKTIEIIQTVAFFAVVALVILALHLSGAKFN